MCQKNSRKIWFSLFFVLVFISGFFHRVQAQEQKVEYSGAIIVDSDFDGLTDQGEIQIYKTDPNNQDTDSDGFYDGSEVLRGTNPLEMTDPLDFELAEQIKQDIVLETPWAWYATRSAGLLGFVFLWLSVFLGLSIRNNWLKKIIEPVYSFDFHCFLGASALFWATVHGSSILLDKFFGMGIKDVLIPFYFQYPNFIVEGINFLALGILAFYGMVILVATSYARNFMSHKVWRALHFLNPLVFVFVVLHGYYIGTDLKNIYARSLFVGASGLLAVIYLSNLFFVLWNKWQARKASQSINA